MARSSMTDELPDPEQCPDCGDYGCVDPVNGCYFAGGSEPISGAQQIADERARQKGTEGYESAHDDTHTDGAIAFAAVAYALPDDRRKHASFAANCGDELKDVPFLWPWEIADWKPTPGNRVRELVKAGALIAAEIDRLQRLER